MAKTSTTRKVTKVARTGGGRTKRGQSSIAFPAFITTVVVLGTALIVFSRAQRAPDTSPPQIGVHHWHSAIGFYVCDSFAPNLADNGQDPLGIHTHGDGVVHTHPFSSQASGAKAVLGVYFDTMGIDSSATSWKLPNEDAHRNGQKCGDAEGEVVTKVWETRAADDQGRIVTGDPADIRLGDSQLITVAFVAKGNRDIPKPPSETQLDNLTDVAPNVSTTTLAPGETTSSTSPESTTTAPTTSTPPTSAP